MRRRRPRRAQRKRAGAESFAAAWDWALQMGFDRAQGAVFANVYLPLVKPIVRRGQIVGEWSMPNFPLMLSALRARESALRSADLPHMRRINARLDVQEGRSAPPPDAVAPAQAPIAAQPDIVSKRLRRRLRARGLL